MPLQSTTRSSGNATGLPGGSLTRRSALRGSAVVAIALAAGVTTQPAAAALDGALIDLARGIEALSAREREAWDRHADAADAVMQASPPTPIRREVKQPYADLDALPPAERYAKLFADPTEFWAASAAADAEHNAAMAEHARVIEAIEKRHGLPRLERQASRLTDQVAAASEKLAELHASTPAGIAAKARVLLAVAGGDPLSSAAEFDRHAALLESLLHDAARLGTGALS